MSDIPAMVSVAVQAFTESTRRPTIGRTFAWKFADGTYKWCRVAVQGASVIGYVTGEPVPCGLKIGQFAVHPTHWRQGVGRAMIGSLERAVRKRGFPSILVGSDFARGFYEKCGFRTIGTTFRLARVLPGSPIPPSPSDTRPVTLDNVSLAIEELPRKVALGFVEAYCNTVTTRNGLGLYIRESGRISGCGVLACKPACREFSNVEFIYGCNSAATIQTLRALQTRASEYGYMWLGISVADQSERCRSLLHESHYIPRLFQGLQAIRPSMLPAVRRMGFSELQLPVWSTTHWLLKELS